MNTILQELRTITENQLRGCILRSHSGIPLYTPDGTGGYPALWTRDFAYMLEYAGELIPAEDAVAGVEYLLAGAGADGWIPDRVDQAGTPFYTAGDGSFGRPNLDNAAFLILAADSALRRLPDGESARLFRNWSDALERGLAALPLDENGLLYNDPADPHSPYGFTDCIGKTGSLLMESLLLWRALRVLAARRAGAGMSAGDHTARARKIEQQVERVFADEEAPMLLAATADCRQIDVWASCYAVSIGFPLPEARRKGIARWLLDNADGLVEAGHIRHTAPGIFWERTLLHVEPGEYQNGAYWTTASGWYMDAVRPLSPEAARNILEDACRYFRQNGVFECINGAYRKLPNYVVSATNLYGAAKAMETL